MKILGIETSCDETAVAIVDGERNILSHIVLSQVDIHKEFGGVVPEVAARNHLDVLDKVIVRTLEKAKLGWDDIDAISATSGPGLIGGVMVGMMTAKALVSALGKPFIAVNHLEGHALVCRMGNELDFPYLLFLLSGGHCQILLVKGVGDYERIGGTLDDALGEAFDKVGQLMGLEYPAGTKIEKLARGGNENRFKFPKPLISRSGKKRNEAHKYSFSFSGLKTAVRREIEKLTGGKYVFGKSHKKLKKKDIADICASFQRTVVEILGDRFESVVSGQWPVVSGKRSVLVISGGVAANQYIKKHMMKVCKKYGYELITPPIKLCTDNGVMIALAGLERFKLGLVDGMDFNPKARWNLEELTIDN